MSRTPFFNGLLALDQHHDQFHSFPKDGERGWGMGVFLLPFVEQQSLFDRLDPQGGDLPDGLRAREGLEDSELSVGAISGKGQKTQSGLTGHREKTIVGHSRPANPGKK